MGPSFVAAAVAAGALSVAPAVLPLAIGIIAGAAVAGGILWACGTVGAHPPLRACGAAVLVGVMLAANGVLRMRMEERSAYVGLAASGPLVLHGAVVDDSRPLARGGTMLAVQVSSVSRPDGALRATARQRMELFLREAESVHRGEVLSVVLAAPPERWRGRLVVRPSHLERHGFRSRFWHLRASLRERVVAALARAGPAAGLATAVLVGDRRYLDQAVIDRFRRAGASHLLALSGLHVGIVYGCVLVLMRLAPRRGRAPPGGPRGGGGWGGGEAPPPRGGPRAGGGGGGA
ncbi:MAG: ComEC/Rec2 family competence protein, partial [Spirochaetaceae bacterium]|nr:ComEC/Rec2 family competence protein [Spirochaetaceae bacterium]